MENLQILSHIVAVITALVAIYNIRILVNSFRADHERRQKQATIEYAAHLLRECRAAIDAKYKLKTLSEEDIERIIKTPDEEAELRNIMGAIEHLAVGVNTGVYDKDILYRMSASYIISIYNRMWPFIDYMRNNFSKNAYTELEHIAKEFEASKKGTFKRQSKGDIKYSKKFLTL